MSDPGPLSGLELARAVLVGLSAGISAAPALAQVELTEPGGLGPSSPAWVARGGSFAVLVALACLAGPRLRGRGPIDAGVLRQEVAIRATVITGLAGAACLPLLVRHLLPDRIDAELGLFAWLLAPVGAGLSGAAGGATWGGAGGRHRAADRGTRLGCVSLLMLVLFTFVLGVCVDRCMGGRFSMWDSGAFLSVCLTLPLLVYPLFAGSDDLSDAPASPPG